MLARMETLFSILLTLVCVVMLSTHALSLPANWGLLIVFVLRAWGLDALADSTGLLIGLGVAAAVGEGIEFLSQSYGTRRYGGTSHGAWGAFFGALAGGILGAPVGFGLGAIPGALAGAYLGALGVEVYIKNRTWAEGARAAKGAFYGKVLGTVLKFGIGVYMLSLGWPLLWP